MNTDALLFWLSARREGSWRQFKAAAEELNDAGDAASETEAGLQVHQRMRFDFDCLAHVEFFARDCETGWRVAPPTLAAHSHGGRARAILCGARSTELVERVVQDGQACGCEVRIEPGEPAVISLISADTAPLATTARRARVLFQADAPSAILSHLAPYVPAPNAATATLPEGRGWRIREFDSTALAWQTVDRTRARTAHTALLEFQLYDRWHYFIRRAGQVIELPRAEALYVFLRRRRGLLRYDPTTAILSVPAACRPPRLLERSLVLCSGRPAVFVGATGRLHYVDVPPDIARLSATLLGQALS
jgi:hypothetical protein